MPHEPRLQALIDHLNATPVSDLPRHAGLLAAEIANVEFGEPRADAKGTRSAVVVHKLKTRITSLLHDRSVAARLTAAVMIKAIVDDNASGRALGASESWVRGILDCLHKPAPPAVKTVFLVTITRIFLLTRHSPSLAKEVTTPLLPAFIKSSVELVKPSPIQSGPHDVAAANPLLDAVLVCWRQLLPDYGSLFRPFAARIRRCCETVTGDRGHGASSSTQGHALHVLCLLVTSSVEKRSFPQEWTQTMLHNLAAASQTADQLFSRVQEEYVPNDPTPAAARGELSHSLLANWPKPSPPRSGAAEGIHEESSRLMAVLTYLDALITSPTPQDVAVPLGALVDLTARIMAVTGPETEHGASTGPRFHAGVTGEEKAQLWFHLPRLHGACLDLLHSIILVFRQALLPVLRSLVTPILDLLASSSWHHGVRRQVYTIFAVLVDTFNGKDLAFAAGQSAYVVLPELCCRDLRAGVLAEAEHKSADPTSVQLVPQASAVPAGDTRRGAVPSSAVFQAAWSLLPLLFQSDVLASTPRPIRTEMETLAILLHHHDAMLASVMRPVTSPAGATSAATLLPFLARSSPGSLTLETLLRPRLPITSVAPVSSRGPRAVRHDTIENADREDAGDPQPPTLSDDRDRRSAEPVQDSPALEQSSREAVESTAGEGKKRRFEDGAPGPAEQGGPLLPPTATLPQAKKPRPESPTVGDAQISTALGDAGMVEAGKNAAPALNSYASQRLERGESSKLAAATTQPGHEDDSDDSEFEIPQIDLGMDTDDDESLEDEE